jgi:hypothetical protein
MDAILVTIVLMAGAKDLSKNASSSRNKKLHLYFIDLNTFQKQCPYLATPLECHPLHLIKWIRRLHCVVLFNDGIHVLFLHRKDTEQEFLFPPEPLQT